jgi:hypothetical protein
MRDKLVSGVTSYFQSEQWRDFIINHLIRKTGEEVYHVHLYVDTSIHPQSINILLDNYFAIIGRPYARSPHPQAQRPGIASIHGIHQHGCPHWEMIFRFNPHVVLEAMPKDAEESEHGQNLLSWDRACMNDFFKDISFKIVGPREETLIKNYFLSRHWKQVLSNVLDDSVSHFHPNLEISFDPKIFEIFATQAMERVGWTVEKVVPSIFDIKNLTKNKIVAEDDPVRQYKYIGKICYILGFPEKMFDFAWLYNPDVVICPAVRGWCFNTPGFDVWKITNYDKFIAQNSYISLTDEEITTITQSFYGNEFTGR